ncbi:uncharacterized protein LOC129594213 isoform X2 [Paramacrobiotus metropolitanus]|uniref:uncharacterized protein LOC129594213 isoform X2 n=1 Tax=Paramacrobiotus metropolitanus TaxID=2943436 RepID=UPI002445D836|nr:uncharacterized protein LOC129594213 isoform X2 [Paramacrobiotus metropolitanus]
MRALCIAALYCILWILCVAKTCSTYSSYEDDERKNIMLKYLPIKVSGALGSGADGVYALNRERRSHRTDTPQQALTTADPCPGGGCPGAPDGAGPG